MLCVPVYYGADCGLDVQATFRTSGSDMGNTGTLLHGIIA